MADGEDIPKNLRQSAREISILNRALKDLGSELARAASKSEGIPKGIITGLENANKVMKNYAEAGANIGKATGEKYAKGMVDAVGDANERMVRDNGALMQVMARQYKDVFTTAGVDVKRLSAELQKMVQISAPENKQNQFMRIGRLSTAAEDAGVAGGSAFAARSIASGQAGTVEAGLSMIGQLETGKNELGAGDAEGHAAYDKQIAKAKEDLNKKIKSYATDRGKHEIAIEDEIKENNKQTLKSVVDNALKSDSMILGSAMQVATEKIEFLKNIAVKERLHAERSPEAKGFTVGERVSQAGIFGASKVGGGILAAIGPLVAGIASVGAMITTVMSIFQSFRKVGSSSLMAQAAAGQTVSTTMGNIFTEGTRVAAVTSDMRTKFRHAGMDMEEFNERSAKAVMTFATFGMDTRAMTGALTRISAISGLTGVSIEQAMDLATKAQQAYNLSADDTLKFFHKTRGAAKLAGLSFSDYSRNLSEVMSQNAHFGGSAELLNQQMAPLMAALGTTEQTPTRQRNFMMKTFASFAGMDTGKALGMQIASGKASGFSGAMGNLQSAAMLGEGGVMRENINSLAGTIEKLGLSEKEKLLMIGQQLGQPTMYAAMSSDKVLAVLTKKGALGSTLSEAALLEAVRGHDAEQQGLDVQGAQRELLEQLLTVAKMAFLALPNFPIWGGNRSDALNGVVPDSSKTPAKVDLFKTR